MKVTRTVFTISDNELAWAAGLFEGNGSLRISKPAKRNWGSLLVDVPNTDEQIVRFFTSRWGGSVKYQPPKGNANEYWRWRAASLMAAEFLRAIQPHIKTDNYSEKIRHGLVFQDGKAEFGGYKSNEYAKEQWNAWLYMSVLNRKRGHPRAVA